MEEEIEHKGEPSASGHQSGTTGLCPGGSVGMEDKTQRLQKSGCKGMKTGSLGTLGQEAQKRGSLWGHLIIAHQMGCGEETMHMLQRGALCQGKWPELKEREWGGE